MARSRFRNHEEFIFSELLKGCSCREVAQKLTELGCFASQQNLSAWLKSRSKRIQAMALLINPLAGLAPAQTAQATLPQPVSAAKASEADPAHVKPKATTQVAQSASESSNTVVLPPAKAHRPANVFREEPSDISKVIDLLTKEYEATTGFVYNDALGKIGN